MKKKELQQAVAELVQQAGDVPVLQIAREVLGYGAVRGEQLADLAKEHGYRPELEPEVKNRRDTLLAEKVALENKLKKLTNNVNTHNNNPDSETTVTASRGGSGRDHPLAETITALGERLSSIEQQISSNKLADRRRAVLGELASGLGVSIDPALADAFSGDDPERLRDGLNTLAEILRKPADISTTDENRRETAPPVEGRSGKTSPAISRPRPHASPTPDAGQVARQAYDDTIGSETDGLREQFAQPGTPLNT